ncbi:MAG: polysaccharide deacetylase family protein [Lentisphaerae bacterium]|nr:polysaccharide deacetylase family protein [Lentisphaerota bacterium]
MQSKLLIGYDVERVPGRVPGEKWVGRKVPEDTTKRFLQRIVDVHRAVNVPATIFMLGRNIEAHLRELEGCAASGLFEIAQHTHDHFPLKTVVEETGSRVYLKGLDFNRIEEQIAEPVALLKRHLGIDCKGITTPYTYYRGLSDRPDILEIIARHGLVYTRSYGRNSLDYFPLGWDLQPFFYDRQGFPDILEFPVQGWIDAQWRHDNGWDKQDEYLAYLKEQVDTHADEGICWAHLQHDWTSLLCDPELDWTRRFLEYAAGKFETLTYHDFYKAKKPESDKETV